jgi:DNA-binding PadR family transcriptional regulator
MDGIMLERKLYNILNGGTTTLAEVRELVCVLMNDVVNTSEETVKEIEKIEDSLNSQSEVADLRENLMFYYGQKNAFKIVYDLLGHISEVEQ